MSSPMFDGRYRSKPRVSLRGASIQIERGGLLERVHKERESRETIRRQRIAAVRIQSLYRGHCVRKDVYAQFRSRFDQLYLSCSCSIHLMQMSQLFLIFYSKYKDEERLVKLCQKWIQFRSEISLVVSHSQSWFFHLTRLLVHSSNSLPSPRITPALLLRTIEIYLSPSTYSISEEKNSELVSKLNTHLVKNQFFLSLLSLMEAKVPPPDDLDTVPSPLATSLLSYMTLPLLGGDACCYEALAREVLARSTSPHLCYLVIPHLVNSDLNLEMLVHSISMGVVSGRVPASLELLYGLLRLVHFRLTSPNMKNKTILDYLHVVSLLLDHAPLNHVTSMDTRDSDADDIMVTEDSTPLSSPEAILRHCLVIVGGEEIPKCIRLKKPLPLLVLNEINGVCYQLIRHCHTLHYSKTCLFQMLSLNHDLLSPMWSNLMKMVVTRPFGEPVLCLQQLARGLPLPSPQAVGVVQSLSTFSALFTFYLNTLHDAEFYREREVPVHCHLPFSLSELAGMVSVLRDIMLCLHMDKHHNTYYSSSAARIDTDKPHPQEWSKLKLLLLDLLCALYRRDCRRPFCPEGHWVAPGQHITIPPELYEGEEGGMDEGLPSPPQLLKQAELLKAAPFVFSFVERVKFFRSLVQHDHEATQGPLQDFLMGPSLSLTVRRDHVYEDAFAELAKDADLRKKLRVNFVNSQGLNEAGIDGGGVFREFLDDVLKIGFDPNRGYFSTTSDGQLYPNPQAQLINEDSSLHYKFLGAMLGKSLYEGQLVELPFAGFFLCKLATSGHGFVGAHHLASFDPDLYRNLLSLKYYDGDIEDMSLNFTVATDGLGQSKVHELKRGGTDIAVTRGNCVEYIHLMAHHRLNVQLHQQFSSFRRGMESVLPYHWLKLFSQNELQVLISGAEIPISVHDLKQNTSYTGVYKDDHDSVSLFWEVVSTFSEEQKRQLLKFVTSCSRPPLLGFKELHPPFKISPGAGDSHLPSASTCMNLLKLPMFKDKETMKSKLLYAIQSGSGFELS